MQTIRDLLSRDLSQPVEEVIKLDQQDEQTVHTEITEYMTTDRIKRQYQEILQPIADAPGDPTEGVGVWISGFFGFGKSSFAKNLGTSSPTVRCWTTRQRDPLSSNCRSNRLVIRWSGASPPFTRCRFRRPRGFVGAAGAALPR